MSWVIRVGNGGLSGMGRDMNQGVAAQDEYRVTSTARHTVAEWNVKPAAGNLHLAYAGLNRDSQAELVWQNVLAALVGI